MDSLGRADGGARRRRSSGGNSVISISAKVDYGVQVLCALSDAGGAMSAGQLARSQGLPHKYLEAILNDLRRGALLISKRGGNGGYRLVRPASQISLGDAIRPLVGTLAEVRGQEIEGTPYDGPAENLGAAWMAVRAILQSSLDQVTIAAIVSGDIPEPAAGTYALPTDPLIPDVVIDRPAHGP